MVTWHYCYNIHYLAQAHIKIITKKHKTSHLEAVLKTPQKISEYQKNVLVIKNGNVSLYVAVQAIQDNNTLSNSNLNLRDHESLHLKCCAKVCKALYLPSFPGFTVPTLSSQLWEKEVQLVMNPQGSLTFAYSLFGCFMDVTISFLLFASHTMFDYTRDLKIRSHFKTKQWRKLGNSKRFTNFHTALLYVS